MRGDIQGTPKPSLSAEQSSVLTACSCLTKIYHTGVSVCCITMAINMNKGHMMIGGHVLGHWRKTQTKGIQITL